MARQLLKDTCELAAEILDGKHDENLDYMIHAAQARKKQMFTRGAQVLFTDKAKDLAGKTGTIVKVNTRTITVAVGDQIFDEFSPDGYWPDGEYNVSPSLIEVL